jgi:hypothetical protein
MRFTNREGLTLAEFTAAATGGIHTTARETKALERAWLAGEDPTEYRNAFNDAKRGKRVPVIS